MVEFYFFAFFIGVDLVYIFLLFEEFDKFLFTCGVIYIDVGDLVVGYGKGIA